MYEVLAGSPKLGRATLLYFFPYIAPPPSLSNRIQLLANDSHYTNFYIFPANSNFQHLPAIFPLGFVCFTMPGGYVNGHAGSRDDKQT